MKPTPQQDILLRKYLRDSLQYRETYQEVCDHLLTALNQRFNKGTLEEAVNQILREDFGGYDKLREMETTAKRAAIADGVSKFMRFFVSYFRLPKVLYTLGAAIIIYFSLGQVKLAPMTFGTIFALIFTIPTILSLRRYYVIGYLFRDTKKSIRDDVFARISAIPARMIVFLAIGMAISISQGHNIWNNVNPAILTVSCALSVIYLLSLFRLYRDEFKLSVIV